jgi:trigger factor
MQFSVETTSTLGRLLKVEVPVEQIEKAVAERLRKTAAKAKIPGFRPGKAPMKIIEAQYGESARYESVSDVVQKTYPEALKQANLRPAESPQLNVTSEDLSQPLTYEAAFEIYPEITLGDLAFTVNQPEVEVSEADIDRLIDNLRKARRTPEAVARAAEKGDEVKFDFKGTLDGVAFDGGAAENATCEIGSGRFLPDFEAGLVGHAAGDVFTVDVAFPEGYQAENLAGKTAQFEMTVHEVKGFALPDVSEPAFLKAHGASDEAELRAKSKQALENERNKASKQFVKKQVLDQLVANHPLEVPKALVAEEIERLRAEAVERYRIGQMPKERQAELLPDAMFADNASRRVVTGLLVEQVIVSQDIRLDEAKVVKALNDLAADYEQPQQVISYYRGNREMMQSLRGVVLEDQVIDVLVQGSTVVPQSMTLEQLLNPAPAAAAE